MENIVKMDSVFLIQRQLPHICSKGMQSPFEFLETVPKHVIGENIP